MQPVCFVQPASQPGCRHVMMSPYIIIDEAEHMGCMQGYALIGRRCIILCKALHGNVSGISKGYKMCRQCMLAIDGSEQANNKDGHRSFLWCSEWVGAYIDGVLVGSHLAAAAAELEKWDEGERQLKGQDHLHTPEITCVQAKITDPLVTLLYALCTTRI